MGQEGAKACQGPKRTSLDRNTGVMDGCHGPCTDEAHASIQRDRRQYKMYQRILVPPGGSPVALKGLDDL